MAYRLRSKLATRVLAWLIGIHALEAYILNPKIMGSQAHIHPVLVAFALLAGELTFGFVGALFAVPVAGVLIAAFEVAHERALRKLQVPEALPPAAEARVPDDRVDPGGAAALQPRDFLAAGVGDDHRRAALHGRAQVVPNQHPVRLVRRLQVPLAEQIVVRP